jgi:hypothetical protein
MPTLGVPGDANGAASSPPFFQHKETLMTTDLAIIEGVTPPPAPKRTPELIKSTIREWIAKHKLWPNRDADEVVDDIASCYLWGMDGYELAKELDNDCGWSITTEDVDTLDAVGLVVGPALKEARKAWAEQHNIQPPLPIGTRIKLGKGGGTIAGICEYTPAAYKVKEDGCTDARRHRIVNFEAAIAEQSA